LACIISRTESLSWVGEKDRRIYHLSVGRKGGKKHTKKIDGEREREREREKKKKRKKKKKKKKEK